MSAFNIGDLVILQYPDQVAHFPYEGATAVVVGVVDGGTDYWVTVLDENETLFLCEPHQLRRPDFPPAEEDEEECAGLVETA